MYWDWFQIGKEFYLLANFPQLGAAAIKDKLLEKQQQFTSLWNQISKKILLSVTYSSTSTLFHHSSTNSLQSTTPNSQVSAHQSLNFFAKENALIIVIALEFVSNFGAFQLVPWQGLKLDSCSSALRQELCASRRNAPSSLTSLLLLSTSFCSSWPQRHSHNFHTDFIQWLRRSGARLSRETYVSMMERGEKMKAWHITPENFSLLCNALCSSMKGFDFKQPERHTQENKAALRDVWSRQSVQFLQQYLGRGFLLTNSVFSFVWALENLLSYKKKILYRNKGVCNH